MRICLALMAMAILAAGEDFTEGDSCNNGCHNTSTIVIGFVIVIVIIIAIVIVFDKVTVFVIVIVIVIVTVFDKVIVFVIVIVIIIIRCGNSTENRCNKRRTASDGTVMRCVEKTR